MGTAALQSPWDFGLPLDPPEMALFRREMALEGFKWDPRVGDSEILCDYPLYLKQSAWTELSRLAEQLDQEVLRAESEISCRPDLVRRLSLPGRIRRQIVGQSTHARGPRVSRYDFHWTSEGWKISEVNSDVPGGYIEASEFAARFASRVGSGATIPGDPTAALADSIDRHACGTGPVALVHATAYSDDAQVMHHIAAVLRTRGRGVCFASPDMIFSANTDSPSPPAHILRFFPAEWLPLLGRRSKWKRYFEDDSIPQTNPATALLSQSKRWALLWDSLESPVPTWRALCPAHREVEPLHRPLCTSSVYKPTLGRVGAGIVMPGMAADSKNDLEYLRARKHLQRDRLCSAVGLRSNWVSQKRFEADGFAQDPNHTLRAVCLGVFVIDGTACGVYGRIASGSWIDMYARDIAVLIKQPTSARREEIHTEHPAVEST